jgi:hypothetical protein
MLRALITVSMKQASIRNKKERDTTKTILDENLWNAIDKFYENNNPVRVSRTLRRIFMGYLSAEKDALPVDFELYLYDITNVLELLDELEDLKG